jgi:hypothetical protein
LPLQHLRQAAGSAFAVVATAVVILGKEKERLLRFQALDQTLDGLLLELVSKALKIGTGNLPFSGHLDLSQESPLANSLRAIVSSNVGMSNSHQDFQGTFPRHRMMCLYLRYSAFPIPGYSAISLDIPLHHSTLRF